MSKKILLLSLVQIFAFSFGSFSEAKKKPQPKNPPKAEQVQAIPDNDFEIVAAVNAKKNANFVSGSNMLVTQLLPDDHNGLPHQKWVVKLSNGKTIQAISNLDMCPKIPVEKGDQVGLGGQFIWTKDGGLIHWLHHDPKGNRPDGFVELDGTIYCDKQ